jgi:hypothetical protein
MLLPILAYRRAQRTVYAVTDRQILSLTCGCQVKAVRYDKMQVPLLDLRSDGSGDIQFDGKFRFDGNKVQPRYLRFLGVGDAESVYQLLFGRMPVADDDQTSFRAVRDYLEVLFQGKRTLDDDTPRG